MSEPPEADDELRPEHWVLQIEKLVAVVIILVMLQLSDVFLGAYTAETLMQFLLFACAIGLLFSKRIAYIGMLFLLWRYVGMLTIATVHFMGPKTIGMAIFVIVLLLLAVVILFLLYLTDKRLREKYTYSRRLNRIVIAAGIATGILLQLFNPPF